MRNLLAALGEASGIRHPCQQGSRLDSTHGSLSVEQERWNPNSCPIRGRIVSSRRRRRCIKYSPADCPVGCSRGPLRSQRRPELVTTARLRAARSAGRVRRDAHRAGGSRGRARANPRRPSTVCPVPPTTARPADPIPFMVAGHRSRCIRSAAERSLSLNGSTRRRQRASVADTTLPLGESIADDGDTDPRAARPAGKKRLDHVNRTRERKSFSRRALHVFADAAQHRHVRLPDRRPQRAG